MNPPPDDLWRLTVKLRSRRLLCDYTKHLGLTGRGLATKAGLSPAIVGFLLKGDRKTCTKATAVAIEEALGCPPGLLFEESVSVVRRVA